MGHNLVLYNAELKHGTD